MLSHGRREGSLKGGESAPWVLAQKRVFCADVKDNPAGLGWLKEVAVWLLFLPSPFLGYAPQAFLISRRFAQAL